MDIRSPLSVLVEALEERLGLSLARFSVWLQDSQALSRDMTLVEQCVQGEGLVQVSLEVRHADARLNILDVLKPASDT